LQIFAYKKNCVILLSINLKTKINKNKKSNMTKNMIKVFSKVFLSISAFSLLVPFSIAIMTSNNNTPNIASAAPVYLCPAGETLTGMDCTIAPTTSPTFATQCPTNFVEMTNICVRRTAKACTDFYKMVSAETGLCKIDPTQIANVLLSDISDSDGRYCRPEVTSVFTSPSNFNVKNFKNASGGAIKVCANILNGLDKTTFRLEMFTIEEIKDYVTIQTGTTTPTCPSNYTIFDNNTKCKRSALAKACDAAGEYFTTTGCTPCPAGQYCPMPNTNNAGTAIACVNGGTLTTDKTKCTANNKVSVTTYTDGCIAPLVKMDKTCVIQETRTHSLGCTYFYATSNANIKAVNANPSTKTQDTKNYDMCSGGTFIISATSGEVVKVSDLECLGTGSAWYNYNVSFDPLVCGVGTLGTASFNWTADTFQKITPLQKIPVVTLVCPSGWTEMDATTCYQPPVTIEYKGPVDCPINTYAMAGASSCTICPNGGTSAVKSMSLSYCNNIINTISVITTVTSVNTIIPVTPTITPVKVPCVSPMGYYTNQNGDCTPCPAGTMSMMVGAKSLADCLKILTCEDFLAKGMGDFKIGDPNYSKERDADGNGVACELPKVVITTVRTGGNQFISLSFLIVSIISGVIGFSLLKKQNSLAKSWSKSNQI
jgi:Excalibur calcium-binding domain